MLRKRTVPSVWPDVVLADAETVAGCEECLKIGERVWNLERLFNLKAGLSGKDDTLPPRILMEPIQKLAIEVHQDKARLLGLSSSDVAQAINLVAEDMSDPVRQEFEMVYAEINYGGDVRRALNGLLERMPLTSVMALITAVNVQKETGGNLAETMDRIATVLRARARLQRRVQTLSAEGRMSTWILALIPVAQPMQRRLPRPSTPHSRKRCRLLRPSPIPSTPRNACSTCCSSARTPTPTPRAAAC